MRVAFRLPFVQTKLSTLFSATLLGLFLLFAGTTTEAQTTYTGTVDFGTVNVGSNSGSQTLTFNFSSPTALNVTTPVQVLTTGVAGLDFKSDGTGTCGSSTYSTCTVGVIFSPTAPGLRLGAVVIKDAAGNILATAYIRGAGHGPQAAFDPGLQSTIGTATDANGLATDGAGNVYIADAATESVYKVAPDGSQTTVTGLASGPDGVTVDGAGNVYVAVPINSTIVKVTPAGVVTQIGTGLGLAGGMAVDGLGNLYIAQVQPSGIVKLAPDGTQTSVGTGLTQPAGVAVDATGNIFVVNDNPSGSIVKIAPDNTQTTLVSGLSYPGAITVDPSGDLYVAMQLAGQVVEYSPTGTQIRTFGHALNNPSAVALDTLGNLYVNSGATQKFDRTPPTVGFVTSSVGVTSTDSPRTATLEDIGNDTLTFPIPGSGTTNPTISSSFSLDSATTCPQLTSSSGAAGTLSMGASCVYSIDFTPTTTGTITGSLVVTDNALNIANATQTITLNNQGAPVIIAATVTVGFVDVTYTGSPVPVSVTTDPAGLAVSITYTSLTTGVTTSTDPSAPDFYMVVATVTTPGYSGSGSNYLIINSPPPPTVPVITWPNPANITVGTPLSATQLDATTTIPGTFTYTPAAGTVLGVGTYTLSTTFTTTQSGYAPSTTATTTLIVQPIAQASAPVNFNTVNVGATGSTQTVTFTFLSGATLGSTPVQVLTQGAAGLDFNNTNAGSCAATTYAATATCTVTVSFTPAAPGPRLGSVVLQDASGNAVATAYIGGVGQGPQIVYDPGAKSIIAPSVGTEGLAIDAAGNLYLNTLSSIVKVTPSGVQTTIASVSGGISGATAIDGAGNIYTLNLANSVVYEITPSGAQYQVGTGWVYPTDLAVDIAGNLYVTDRGYNPPPDTTGGRLSKVTAAGVQTTVAGPFVNPEFVAVDSAGNVYVTDNAGLGIINPGLIGVVYKVNSFNTLLTVASGLFNPGGIAVDPFGNLFVGGASTNSSIDKITQAGVRTKLYDGQISFPGAVKLSPSGDFYITQAVAGAQLVKFDRSTLPSLTFQSTTINTTSTDSPQAVTIDNIGNATLTYAVPKAGTTNASISPNFSFAAATTCPVATHSSTLASGASCVYSVAFLPTTTGTISGAVTQTDNNLNGTNLVQAIPLTGTGSAGVTAATVTLSNLNQTYTGSPLSVTAMTNPTGLAVSITYNGSATPPTSVGSYAVVATITDPAYTGSTTGTLVIAQATPVITWANPAGITYGTALSATQLNATASVPGTFVYTPAAGATPNAGTDTLSVVFTPTDAVDYTTASANVSIVVSQATPVITWANPAGITYGTALSATQLNATASVPGTFAYTPAAGTLPSAGTDTLSVTFTPTDATNYTTATKSVSIVVNQATPVITWANPAAITYGTALGATQLNATASVPGTFAYTPAAGTTPGVGTVTLSVLFTPTDTTDYTTATTTVSLTVTQATPTITWANPAAITYGTQLSTTELNATASVPGTFSYTPAAGTTPATGTDTLSVTFTPNDATDYTTATATVSLVVNQATPVVTWTPPAGIAYGTALSATQLNATASVPGTFVYTPAAGTIPAAGTDTLSVTFTPTDSTNYATVTKTVQLAVSQATPVITWANPTGITYGTALSATQLNATASVAGTFSYTPAAGTIPAAGTDTLSVTFTPTDATDYTTATKTVTIVVGQATPVITWATPAAISYGTALSATQLNATASVPGTFVYTPAAGAVPLAGTDTLSVTFTPTDTLDYTSATKSVSILVTPPAPVITWANPVPITYGTQLSATQLNATASVAGTFSYTPAAGTTPSAGTDTLSVTFTPTDTTDYTTATATVSLVVNQATPAVTWANPAGIAYGAALGATQLNATASVPGTFAYTPVAGTVPAAGTDTLSVTFTPTDATDYVMVTKTVQLAVSQATPVITWANPAAITYGTALSATQLNATASVPGTFSYTPAAGTIPAAGTDTLSVTFSPTDATDYTSATKTVSIVVSQATPVITWADPASISYGTALSATQLNATASVPGTFVYTPAAGAVPLAGTDTLSVTFTPTDTTDYTMATKSASIVVTPPAPVITWANPAAITYGTPLSATQLNATASVAGTFAYTPVAGTVLLAGTSTLSVTFTPTDTTDYTTATKSVAIVVNPATLTVSAANATRVYGTANPTFTGSVSGNQNGDTFSETFTTTATILSSVGTYAIVPAVTDSNLTSYTQAVVNGTLTIAQAGSTTTLGVSSTNPAAGQTVTLTAQIASATSGTPTGSVQFLDGATVLNTATLTGGTATFATSTLAIGTHSLTAVYLGDTNFTGSNSGGAQVVTVSGTLDFTISAITQTQTVIPGAIASYSFNVAPVNGTYPSSVSFAASGLPPGATVTFSPSSIAANGGPQTVTVAIQTSTAIIAKDSSRSLPPITLALLLLPFAGARRFRKSGRRMARMAAIVLLLGGGAVATAALSGCGTNNGFFGQSQKTYNVTVTATSGTVSHTATVTLDLE